MTQQVTIFENLIRVGLMRVTGDPAINLSAVKKFWPVVAESRVKRAAEMLL